LLAQNASKDAVLAAKYAYELGDILNVSVRACNDFRAIATEFQPAANATRYQVPVADRDPPTPAEGRSATYGYFGVSLLLMLIAGALPFLRGRMRVRR
jgi:hypothetical protein